MKCEGIILLLIQKWKTVYKNKNYYQNYFHSFFASATKYVPSRFFLYALEIFLWLPMNIVRIDSKLIRLDFSSNFTEEKPFLTALRVLISRQSHVCYNKNKYPMYFPMGQFETLHPLYMRWIEAYEGTTTLSLARFLLNHCS